MNRQQQSELRIKQAKDVVNSYLSNGKNASTTAKEIGRSRERIRQILGYAIENGLMGEDDKRGLFNKTKYLPLIAKIIKDGGDIYDIIKTTKLPMWRINWCLRMLHCNKKLPNRVINRVTKRKERSTISFIVNKNSIAGRLLSKLYQHDTPLTAKELLNLLCEDEVVRYKTVYSLLAQLNSVGKVVRVGKATYKLNDGLAHAIDKYIDFMPKGGVNV